MLSAMPHNYKLHSAFFVALLVFSCQNARQSNDSEGKDNITKKQLVDINEKLVKSEDMQIESFIQRYGWEMKTTKSGLRYSIYRKGNGKHPVQGNTVQYYYVLSLLSGDTVSSVEKGKPATLILGKREVERGLEEGILLMSVGDRAKFIIPSHLALGLQGDLDKIPPRSALVYDIELKSIKQ